MLTVYGCCIKLGIEEILSYVQRITNESIKEHVPFFFKWFSFTITDILTSSVFFDINSDDVNSAFEISSLEFKLFNSSKLNFYEHKLESRLQ